MPTGAPLACWESEEETSGVGCLIFLFVWFGFSEIGSDSAAQAGLRLPAVLLCQPLEGCWDYRHGPAYLTGCQFCARPFIWLIMVHPVLCGALVALLSCKETEVPTGTGGPSPLGQSGCRPGSDSRKP